MPRVASAFSSLGRVTEEPVLYKVSWHMWVQPHFINVPEEQAACSIIHVNLDVTFNIMGIQISER